MRKRSLHKVYANQETCQIDEVWSFLAEVSIVEFLRMVERGDEPVVGKPFQDLGIPAEYIRQVMRTLADFAQLAMMHAHPGTPAAIRLFCQEKMREAGNPAETMLREQKVAGSEIIFQAHPQMSGGWGYFLVERNGDFTEDRLGSSPKLIDLYVYREGK